MSWIELVLLAVFCLGFVLGRRWAQVQTTAPTDTEGFTDCGHDPQKCCAICYPAHANAFCHHDREHWY